MPFYGRETDRMDRPWKNCEEKEGKNRNGMRIEEADVAMTKTLFFGGVFFNVLYTLRVAAARLCCCLNKNRNSGGHTERANPPRIEKKKIDTSERRRMRKRKQKEKLQNLIFFFKKRKKENNLLSRLLTPTLSLYFLP